MKAKLIKENLRITTNYKKDMYPTVHHAFFQIKFDDSEDGKL